MRGREIEELVRIARGAGAIVMASGPLGGTFSNEDLRVFQMFMEKCSLAVQLLATKQRLMVLPAEMVQ